MKKTLIVVSVVLALVGSYVLGVQVGRLGFDEALSRTQGELAFNHLKRYELLKSLVEEGCASTVINNLEVSINQQKNVLLELISTFNSESVSEYIADRDSELLRELETIDNFGKDLTIFLGCEEEPIRIPQIDRN